MDLEEYGYQTVDKIGGPYTNPKDGGNPSFCVNLKLGSKMII